MQVFDFILSDEDMRLIESINKSWRALIPDIFIYRGPAEGWHRS